MKKKIILLLISILMIGIILTRIIYVNVTYSYAGVNYLKENEEFYLNNISMKVNNYGIYSKEEWKEKLSNDGYSLEEEVNSIIYNKEINNDSIYDYIVTYNPKDDYKVLYINMEITNSSNEEQSVDLDNKVEILTRLDRQALQNDKYYQSLYNDENYMYKLKVGEKRNVILIYITNYNINKFILEAKQIGNNQRAILE